jgi:hypothetical protein
LAVANYVDERGHFPPAFLANGSGQALLSWRVLLLPYINGNELYKQFDLNESWDSPTNVRLLKQMPSVYRLHTIADDNHTAANYVAVVGDETVWGGVEGRPVDFVTDSRSNTLLIAEFVGHPIPWTKPEDLLFAEMDMTVDSDSGICSVLTPPAYVSVDGLVQHLPQKTDKATVRALLTAQGGEPPGHFPTTSDGRLRPRKPG